MMAVETGEVRYGPITDDNFKGVIFSGPAVLADRVAVTEQEGIFRVSVAEMDLNGAPQFRGAVALSTENARQLRDILTKILENVDERNARR